MKSENVKTAYICTECEEYACTIIIDRSNERYMDIGVAQRQKCIIFDGAKAMFMPVRYDDEKMDLS
jgi:hypothetical protein